MMSDAFKCPGGGVAMPLANSFGAMENIEQACLPQAGNNEFRSKKKEKNNGRTATR